MTYTYRDANGVTHVREIEVRRVSLVKSDDYTTLVAKLADMDSAAPARIPEVRQAMRYPTSHALGKINTRTELSHAYAPGNGFRYSSDTAYPLIAR